MLRRSYPEPGQIALSDATKSWVYVRDLVWAKRRYLEPANQNYCPYSDYSSTFWTSTATDEGAISIGSDVLAATVNMDTSGTQTYQGVQTWSGNGSLTSQDATFSGATSACFSCIIGHYFGETAPGFIVTLTLKDQDGATLATQTWPQRKTGFRPSITCSIPSTVTAAIMVVSVVAVGKWYVECVQLEKNTSVPGPFCKTSGAAVVNLVDRVRTDYAKVEKEEVERVVEDWETRGVPRGDPSFVQVTKVADNG